MPSSRTTQVSPALTGPASATVVVLAVEPSIVAVPAAWMRKLTPNGPPGTVSVTVTTPSPLRANVNSPTVPTRPSAILSSVSLATTRYGRSSPFSVTIQRTPTSPASLKVRVFVGLVGLAIAALPAAVPPSAASMRKLTSNGPPVTSSAMVTTPLPVRANVKSPTVPARPSAILSSVSLATTRYGRSTPFSVTIQRSPSMTGPLKARVLVALAGPAIAALPAASMRNVVVNAAPSTPMMATVVTSRTAAKPGTSLIAATRPSATAPRPLPLATG